MRTIAAMRRVLAATLWASVAAGAAAAFAPQGQTPIATGVRDYVKADAPIVALVNARVSDGTGRGTLVDSVRGCAGIW